MNRPELEPLPRDVAELLRAESEPPRLSEPLRSQVLGRIERITAPPPVPTSFLRPVATHLFVAVASFAAGGGLVELLGSDSAAPTEAPATPVVAAREAPPPTPNQAPPPPLALAPSPARAKKRQPQHPAVEPRPPDPSPDGDVQQRRSLLERERLLVAAAHAALTRRDLNAALTAVTAHLSEFPDGQLAEEREALWVRVLAASGQRDAALSRAQAFRGRFPSSFLWPQLERALE